MDSIQDFFPKGCDPKRPITISETNVEWTFSMLMDILQHVFRDGIEVEKCPNCEPADEKILDLSFEQAVTRATLHHKCAKCGRKFTSINRAQYDHKNGKNWDNSLRNCQALHAGCHDAKSRKQSKTRAKTTKKKKSGFKPVKVGDFTF